MPELTAGRPPWLQSPLAQLLAMRGSLPHALLIHGPKGVGKGLLAERFAKSLLCESTGGAGEACDHCGACAWFDAGNHPDFRRVSPLIDEEAAGKKERSRHEIKIDQIRALADFVGVGAHRAGHKVLIVEPAESMNSPAANALLKTLEEPSGETIFLLVCGQIGRVPATVRSRCIPFPVGLPARDQAATWLRESLGGSPEEADGWLSLAGGAPLRARDFAEPAAAAAYRLILQLAGDIPENPAMRSAEGLATVPAAVWLPLLQAWTGDLARACAGAGAVRFPAQNLRLKSLAGRTDLARIGEFAQWLAAQSPILEHPLNARLLAEDVMLRYEALFQGQSPRLAQPGRAPYPERQ